MAIRALDSPLVNYKLFWECHQSLVKLAEHNRFQLLCMLRYVGIDGSKLNNQITNQGSSLSFTRPEPVLGISAKVAGGETGGWMSRKGEEDWLSFYGQKQARGFL